MPALELRGLMTMAAFDADDAGVAPARSGCCGGCGMRRSSGEWPLPELSMGMSGDYPIAVEEGATLVRLGTVLFGERT